MPAPISDWLPILRAIAPKGSSTILQSVAGTFPGLIPRFQIDTPRRQAHFLGQIAHESAGFRYVTELGTDQYFARYNGRKDLGNGPHDGARYRGRGLIQLTGRKNYQFYGSKIGADLVNHPEAAAAFPYAAMTAGAFWQWNGLNRLADIDDLIGITRKINGGTNGLASRQTYVARAKKAIALASVTGRLPALAKV